MPFVRKDAGTLTAEAKMTRSVHRGAVVLVEGITDEKFWRSKCIQECAVLKGDGKKNVVGSIDRLEKECFPGVLGIVDDDYDSLLGKRTASFNLVATETHDLECLLCRSSALDIVLAELGVQTRISEFEEREGLRVREALLERAVIFGLVRLEAAKRRRGIDEAAIHVRRFVDPETWRVDTNGLYRAAIRDGLAEWLETWEARMAVLEEADRWRVARGHDMVQILEIGLTRVLGKKGGNIGKNGIARLLRVAIPVDELRRTTTGLEVLAWEARNKGYAVLLPPQVEKRAS